MKLRRRLSITLAPSVWSLVWIGGIPICLLPVVFLDTAGVLWGATALFVLAMWRNVTVCGLLSGPATFVGFLGLFHLGLVVPVVLFGAPLPVVRMPWLSSELVTPALAMFILALGAFQAGLERGNLRLVAERSVLSSMHREGAVQIARVALLLTVLFGIVYIYTGLTTEILFNERHEYLEARITGESRLFGTARMLMIISAFIVIAHGTRRQILVGSVLVLILLFPMFIGGNRGEFLVTAAAIAVVMRARGIVINRALMIVLLIIVWPTITYIRNLRSGIPTFASWYLDPLYEMGMQLRTVIYTIDSVRQNFTDWWLGTSYVDAFTKVLPNIGGLRDALSLSPFRRGPSEWLTDIYRPSGSGLGFSVIAEPYLNFGWVGVAIVMFLLGLILSRVSIRGVTSPYFLAVYGVFLKELLWLVRNNFVGLVRPVIWAIVFGLAMIIAVRAFSKKERKVYARSAMSGA